MVVVIEVVVLVVKVVVLNRRVVVMVYISGQKVAIQIHRAFNAGQRALQPAKHLFRHDLPSQQSSMMVTLVWLWWPSLPQDAV